MQQIPYSSFLQYKAQVLFKTVNHNCRYVVKNVNFFFFKDHGMQIMQIKPITKNVNKNPNFL